MVSLNGAPLSMLATNKKALANIFLSVFGLRMETNQYHFEQVPGLGRAYYFRRLLEDEVLKLLEELENPCFESPLNNGARYIVANLDTRKIVAMRTIIEGEMQSTRKREEIEYFLNKTFPGRTEERIDLTDVLYTEIG